MELFLTFINHATPVIITVAVIFVIVAVKVGFPYLQYVAHVSQANTYQGKVELAKYLARTTGGRKINVEDTWPTFLAAAAGLHKSHIKKRNSLHK